MPAELTNLRGERRRVAVLFSDLRGFTSFSEGKEPAVVVDRLNQYFDRMVDAISRNGGTVDKFIGDAVMATFGGLIPVDNPAVAALNASLAMRAELKTLNEEWGKQGLSPLDNGIGVHFGDVLQGPIGSSTRKEFTVIGDVVNTASRLESVTKELGCPVVFSAVAREHLPEAQRATLTPLGDIKLKGKAEAVKSGACTAERARRAPSREIAETRPLHRCDPHAHRGVGLPVARPVMRERQGWRSC